MCTFCTQHRQQLDYVRNGNRIHSQFIHKKTLSHLSKLGKCFSYVASPYLYGAFDSMLSSCHLRVSEWIREYKLCSCLNAKELLAWNKCDIWSLRNGTRTYKLLAHKHTVNCTVKIGTRNIAQSFGQFR